jgi:hypothetical protein
MPLKGQLLNPTRGIGLLLVMIIIDGLQISGYLMHRLKQIGALALPQLSPAWAGPYWAFFAFSFCFIFPLMFLSFYFVFFLFLFFCWSLLFSFHFSFIYILYDLFIHSPFFG